MEYHFIYLLKEEQDRSSIYKIGKSTQRNTKRVQSYPRGSHLLLQVACNNCHEMEKYLIKVFKELFIVARGREYFEGDPFRMINLIFLSVQVESHNEVEYRMITPQDPLSIKCINGIHNYSFTKDNVESKCDLDDYFNELDKRSLETDYNSLKKRYASLEKGLRRNKFQYKRIAELQRQNDSLTKELIDVKESLKKSQRHIEIKEDDDPTYGLYIFLLCYMSYTAICWWS